MAAVQAKVAVAALLTLLLSAPMAAEWAAAAATVLLDERFESLDRWRPLTFPKISRHSLYSTDRCDGEPCLRMESDNAASAMVLRQSFNVYDYPRLAWRWKVGNVYRKGDSRTRAGDDYPARLYVMFAYDPDRASLARRLQYRLARAVYGSYPPDSSISYIWDNRPSGAPIIVNAYTAAARMIPVSAGSAKVGTWQEYEVDIVRDYRLAFGEEPPATASLAVMIDSDDTGESATAWIRYIRIFRTP